MQDYSGKTMQLSCQKIQKKHIVRYEEYPQWRQMVEYSGDLGGLEASREACG
jgi:hypothetical protein